MAANAANLVHAAMNAGHRRRRALVDVRGPQVERPDGALEQQSDDQQRDPDEQQHVATNRRSARPTIAENRIEPAYPYSRAMPYSRIAEVNAPSRKYLTAASW